jgi:SNF2 family DNA or RNA helicase
MKLTKTTSYAHQLKIIEESKDRNYAGYFMEQGTGKTHVTIAVATHLFLGGKIEAVLVLAPNGVHDNWAINEIPLHCSLPDSAREVLTWHSSDGVKKRNAFEHGLSTIGPGKLTYILANVEALRTKAFMELMEKYLIQGSIFDTPTSTKWMMVIDESTVIKSMKADMTKAAIKLGGHAMYKRILTGTPVTQGPMDLFSQCRFLGKDVLPYNSQTAFKCEFVIEQAVDLGPGRPRFNKIIGYRNQDKLARLLLPFTWRVMKADCLDLPPKIYQTRYVELTPDQKRIYKELVRTSLANLDDSTVTVLNAITLMLRLQQVTLGYVTNDEKVITDIPTNRINVLNDLISEMAADAKVIIFCRFRADIDKITADLCKEYGRDCFTEYHGGIDDDGRSTAVRSFQEKPSVRFFVATKAAARGLTLTAATQVVYYSQDFSLEARLQSEDRAHRIGQKSSVVYTNLVARGTVDEKVIAALMKKQDIANLVLDRSAITQLILMDD